MDNRQVEKLAVNLAVSKVEKLEFHEVEKKVD
jgi:hypothetical protein